ncbi:MAG: biotin transporter BioY [Clostridia bacterium]|nr:biotin transporter BioY [Clostridia bacterium]
MSDKKQNSTRGKAHLKNAVLISLFTAILAVCSIITIPSPVPFTLQALGIFCALTVLGGRNGTATILLYSVLGLVGVPVFSGLSAGPGHLLGATGGYIIGFILCALVYWLVTSLFHNTTKAVIGGLTAGLLTCYATGTLWYALVYLGEISESSLSSAIIACVVPFVIPDIIKLIVAVLISRKLQAIIK